VVASSFEGGIVFIIRCGGSALWKVFGGVEVSVGIELELRVTVRSG
jgi:hypothetical protein